MSALAMRLVASLIGPAAPAMYAAEYELVRAEMAAAGLSEHDLIRQLAVRAMAAHLTALRVAFDAEGLHPALLDAVSTHVRCTLADT